MKNLFLRMMALAIISTLIITGCGAVNAAPKQQPADTATTTATVEQAQPADTATTTATAEQAQPVDTATTTATAEQAQPVDTATTTATAEQAADETDTVCITFSDTDEVLKCRRLDGDTYSCSTSTHTFKMRGFGTVEEGRYKYEDLPAEWQMMITKAREHDNW